MTAVSRLSSAPPRLLALSLVLALAAACASAPPPAQTAESRPPTPATGARAAVPPAPAPAPLPDHFRSEDYVVTLAKAGDTPATLAERYLGDANKAWMIEDFAGSTSFTTGQEVVIPLRPWNLSGVDASGYQIVPILVYHNLGPQAKGRLVLAAKSFEQQMRYLKAEGYRVISLGDFVEAMRLQRQLPRKAVVLTFDDGYRAFLEYAYPILKELGFTATLFVYTDYLGAGRNSLSWDELRKLASEGFDIEAHSKSHADLRRASGETDAQFARRMQSELAEPLRLFQRNLGRTTQILAYPYGRTDDEVVRKVRDVGYVAAFTVRRQGSPYFVAPLRANRSQIYSEMSLEDFARNLNIFQREDLQ
jgi:peptidoglycan/xylan/chitin deacetylase (PgdA/CDA1 family)